MTGYHCTGEEFLRITSVNADADAVLELAARVREEGRLAANITRERHVPNTDRTAKTDDFPIGAGVLEHVTVRCSSGTPLNAQTYVRVELVRGRGAVALSVATLLQGYVTAAAHQAWPLSLLRSPLEGPGALKAFAGSAPVAGAEIAETVPAGARWRLLGGLFSLASSADAANREVCFVVNAGASTLFVWPSGFNHTAVVSRRYTVSPLGVGQAPTQASDRQLLVPSLVLPAGATFGTTTVNIQAADQYTAPQWFVEEWLEP